MVSDVLNTRGITGKSDALREFARDYFDDHDEERVAAAVALYERETIALSDTARLAGVNRSEMKDILRDHGIEPRIGPADEADAEYEVEAARELKYAHTEDKANDDGSGAE